MVLNLFEQTPLGLIQKTDRLLLFFGNKNTNLENLRTTYSDLNFKKIKQTHSNIFVKCSDFLTEADAHFTNEENTALLISTADCLPVLVYCNQTFRVASIHAGWKGVANQIVFKTIKNLISTGSNHKDFNFWVGPYIQQKSFEIKLDVLQQLQLSAYHLSQSEYCSQKEDKFYVDLSKIINSQIKAAGCEKSPIWFSDIDTKTDTSYWSYRRDKESVSRNLSFIALRPAVGAALTK